MNFSNLTNQKILKVNKSENIKDLHCSQLCSLKKIKEAIFYINCANTFTLTLLSTLYFLLYLILETHVSPFIQVCVFFIYHRDPQRYFLLRWNLMLVGNTCNLLYHKSHSHGNLAHTHIQTEGFSDSIPSRILTLYRILMEEIHSSY